ncbi:Hypothetical predicted protein [Lecanosticta acicola]|uniref:DUF7707 domain-containing protein n=1 Tax=Lecanosticta acicola TaxID=111012 RepID=A0AAI8Z1L7_9PEZI|nr:Hypothetical predicted protein [Lecanosticta acicola]
MKPFTRFSIATAVLLTAVSAQVQYSIDPNSVDNSTRQYWCQEQQAECPLICLQSAANSASTSSNDCDPSSLTYACVCSNGLSPNVSEYSQTLPYYICQEWGNQCVSNCGIGNNDCSEQCRSQHPCGALNPTRQNTSTLTSTMAKTSTGGAGNNAAVTTDSNGQTIYSGLGGGSASGSGSNSGASTRFRGWALDAAQTFGMVGLVGAFIGGFAVLL